MQCPLCKTIKSHAIWWWEYLRYTFHISAMYLYRCILFCEYNFCTSVQFHLAYWTYTSISYNVFVLYILALSFKIVKFVTHIFKNSRKLNQLGSKPLVSKIDLHLLSSSVVLFREREAKEDDKKISEKW